MPKSLLENVLQAEFEMRYTPKAGCCRASWGRPVLFQAELRDCTHSCAPAATNASLPSEVPSQLSLLEGVAVGLVIY